ncbi:MAG: hypothetical protein AMJ91_00400 [candidate division Zixibacteria bacterium SM23_73_3]|nr:MAG: hypothetical protein AMJ91_00400 [candidate division Zixibacteria bacterium SM23_73_3]
MNFSDLSKNLWTCVVVLMISGCCLFSNRNLEEYFIRAKNSSPIDSVELKLELDRTIFQQNENIEGKLHFVNQRSADVTINSRFSVALKKHSSSHREIYFEIYKDGKETQLIYYTLHNIYPVTKKHFVTLKPGEAYTVQTCIMRPIPLPIEKGHYKVYSIYENYYGPEFGFPHALMGIVKSNAVEFIVE